MVESVASTENSEAATETTPADDATVDTTTALGGAETESGDDAATEGKTEGETVEAAPEKVIPETYELTAPEGFTIADEDIAAATPVFKELGLDNDQANKLIPIAADFAKRSVEASNSAAMAHIMEQRATWLSDAKSDPEIGGDKFDATVRTAAKALDTLGAVKGSPLRNLLDESGLGNHPEMIRAWAKVGKAIGEDSAFERGSGAATAPKTDAELFYPTMTKGA